MFWPLNLVGLHVCVSSSWDTVGRLLHVHPNNKFAPSVKIPHFLAHSKWRCLRASYAPLGEDGCLHIYTEKEEERGRDEETWVLQ